MGFRPFDVVVHTCLPLILLDFYFIPILPYYFFVSLHSLLDSLIVWSTHFFSPVPSFLSFVDNLIVDLFLL